MVKIDELKEGNSKKKREGIKELEWQMWHLNGTRCPKGTIPVRRSTVHDVLRAKSLYDFGKKRPRSLMNLARKTDAPDVVNGNGHEVCNLYLFLVFTLIILI